MVQPHFPSSVCLHCRQENGSMHIPPMETSFGHWNMLLLLQDENLIIGRIFAGNPNIRFFRCLPNWDVISSLNLPKSHDPNSGKSVHRMIQEGSLALFRTSYKELSQRVIHPSSGVHHLFLKRDKFHSESAGFTLAITCLLHISPS